ncbi:MAG: cysteine protease [Bacteroidetes bacterium]|nr:cysteine protease [Bacteroidota bacterium]
MPIRMTNDDDSGSGWSGNQGSRGSGGGGGGIPLIGWIIPLLFRYPKLLIVVLIVGGIYYFTQKGCSGPAGAHKKEGAYGTGANMDPAVYDKNEVYAALDNGEPLPEKVSLERFAPSPGNQGEQGSCVGWGSTYCGRTVLESVITNQNPDQIKFSPAFTYNQIGAQGCQGSYITDAVQLMTSKGAVPYDEFPYDAGSCEKKPDERILQDASKYRMCGGNRLTLTGDDYTVDVNAMRQNLAHNAPVIIGMSVGGTFMHDMEGEEVWMPDQSDYSKNGFGGHCICVIGYDDNFFQQDGAFLIQNSWGPQWGKNGRAWISYKDLVYFTNEAYGIDAMPSRVNESKLQCSIGMVDKESKSEITLKNKGPNLYSVASPLKIGQKFKMRLTNNIECYVYIFGKESDNGSYVLFPYTAKHSAYCGITGTRLFPRDYNMEPDKIGNKDYFAVLVSKKRLDYKALNEKLNADKTTDFSKRIMNLVADDKIEDVNFENGNSISFKAETKEKSIIPVIIEVDKL